MNEYWVLSKSSTFLALKTMFLVSLVRPYKYILISTLLVKGSIELYSSHLAIWTSNFQVYCYPDLIKNDVSVNIQILDF